jgi:hypothetical protein
MQKQMLALGVVMGFALAMAPSCGSPCGPRTCNGCCDATGMCINVSNVDATCGTLGARCDDCTASQQVCDATTFSCTARSCSVAAKDCPAGAGQCVAIDQAGAARCFPGACDTLLQDCPTGGRCLYAPLSDGGVGRTCGSAGTVAENAACGAGGSDDCGVGLSCVSVAGQRTCHRYCATDTDCGASARCSLSVSFTGTAEKPTFCLSVMPCDPLASTCPANQTCTPLTGGSVCTPAGTVMDTGVCSSQAACVVGDLCLVSTPGETSGTCRKICNLDAGQPACTSGTCTPLLGVAFGACN